MKEVLSLVVATVALMSAGCAKRVGYKDEPTAVRAAATGFNKYGEVRSCYTKNPPPSCPDPEEDETDGEYKMACQKSGFFVAVCDCGSYLCSGNPNAKSTREKR